MTIFQKIMIGISLLFLVCIILCCGILTMGNNESSTVPIEVVEESPNVAKNETVQPKKDKEVKAPFEIVTNEEGLKISVTKVTNDDLLKIYVEYENNTGMPISPCQSLSKIISNGKQIEYDYDINNMLTDDIEDGVIEKSVMVFKKIDSNKFNLVFNCNYEDYRINNIVIGE